MKKNVKPDRIKNNAFDERVSIKKGEPFIVCQNLVKLYQVDEIEVFALQGLDMVIRKGEVLALIGASGSGKSTLLNILGGLDSPTGGQVLVGAWNLTKMKHREFIQYRRQVVGFVWQNVSRNLVPYLSALENITLPMVLNGSYNRAWAKELLFAVGLGDRMNHTPEELSGGQQQRVAIAIAAANKPELILADEPTGSLDHKSGDLVLDVFHRMRDMLGVTVLIVTHDMLLAKKVDRFLKIRDGKITSEVIRRKDFDKHEHEHDEYTILDSAGRLQIPEEYRKELQITNKVKLKKEGNRIVIIPPDK